MCLAKKDYFDTCDSKKMVKRKSLMHFYSKIFKKIEDLNKKIDRDKLIY